MQGGNMKREEQDKARKSENRTEYGKTIRKLRKKRRERIIGKRERNKKNLKNENDKDNRKM